MKQFSKDCEGSVVMWAEKLDVHGSVREGEIVRSTLDLKTPPKSYQFCVNLMPQVIRSTYMEISRTY